MRRCWRQWLKITSFLWSYTETNRSSRSLSRRQNSCQIANINSIRRATKINFVKEGNIPRDTFNKNTKHCFFQFDIESDDQHIDIFMWSDNYNLWAPLGEYIDWAPIYISWINKEIARMILNQGQPLFFLFWLVDTCSLRRLGLYFLVFWTLVSYLRSYTSSTLVLTAR